MIGIWVSVAKADQSNKKKTVFESPIHQAFPTCFNKTPIETSQSLNHSKSHRTTSCGRYHIYTPWSTKENKLSGVHSHHDIKKWIFSAGFHDELAGFATLIRPTDRPSGGALHRSSLRGASVRIKACARCEASGWGTNPRINGANSAASERCH